MRKYGKLFLVCHILDPYGSYQGTKRWLEAGTRKLASEIF